MRTGGLTAPVLILLVINNVWETAAHFCFKKASASLAGPDVHQPQQALPPLQQLLLDPFLWLGLLAVGLFVLTWVAVLSKIDLSLAVPFASLSYVFIAVACAVFLNEHISPQRWMGIVMIALGVVLVSVSSRRDRVPKL